MNGFQIAVFYGHIEIVRIMLDFIKTKKPRLKKKMINTLNRKSSMSALSYALVNDQLLVAQELIVNDA